MLKKIIAAAFLGLIAGAAPTLAQDTWPSRPLTMVVPFAAGGPSPALREKLGGLGLFAVAPQRWTPDYLGTFVASEIRKWAAPIRASGAVGE